MKLSWNWLKDYVALKQTPEEVARRLTMAGLVVERVETVGKDVLLEAEVTSNRSDWLSHIGVAREIAAVFGVPLKLPACKIKPAKATAQKMKVEVRDSALCPFYSGAVLEDVASVKTPDWMAERLAVCGIRSVQFVVDVTNYVLLECGQPLHAFDLEKLRGSVIAAQRAKPNEKMTAIDGTVCELLGTDVVIADRDGTVALGGVMGGKESEVSSGTRHIFLESAFFTPPVIRKTSRRLKLLSESSYRFERGVDPAMVDWARDRAVSLIAELAGVGAVGKPVRAGRLPSPTRRVTLDFKKIVKILGPVSISFAQAKRFLNRLHIPTQSQGKKLVALIPSFRPDLAIPEDLIEEIARLYGYDKIPETVPTLLPLEPKIDPLLLLADQARDLCVGMGLHEIVTFSLSDPVRFEPLHGKKEEWVMIHNPRNQQLTLMRPSFSGSLLEVIRQNLHMGVKSIAVFEVGSRYYDLGKPMPEEEKMLAFGLCGSKPSSWLERERPFAWHELKGMVTTILGCLRGVSLPEFLEYRSDIWPGFAPSQGFEIYHKGTWLGVFGAIRQDVCTRFDIEKPVLYGALSLAALAKMTKPELRYQNISKYPSVERDIALVVDESVRADDLRACISVLGKDWIQQIQLFDVFRGGKLPQGKKSVAFRLTYQSKERTLETAEVNELHFSIANALNERFKAELPSKA